MIPAILLSIPTAGWVLAEAVKELRVRRLSRLLARSKEREGEALAWTLKVEDHCETLEHDVALASARSADWQAIALRHQLWAEDCHTRMLAAVSEVRAMRAAASARGRHARRVQMANMQAIRAETTARLNWENRA